MNKLNINVQCKFSMQISAEEILQLARIPSTFDFLFDPIARLNLVDSIQFPRFDLNSFLIWDSQSRAVQDGTRFRGDPVGWYFLLERTPGNDIHACQAESSALNPRVSKHYEIHLSFSGDLNLQDSLFQEPRGYHEKVCPTLQDGQEWSTRDRQNRILDQYCWFAIHLTQYSWGHGILVW